MSRMCLCSQFMFYSYLELPFLAFLVYIARDHEQRLGANSHALLSVRGEYMRFRLQ